MGAIPHQQSTHALELHTLGNVCIDIGINEKQCIWGDESCSDGDMERIRNTRVIIRV